MPPIPYIAGFFDGEGSIGVYPNSGGGYHLRTQLTQNVSTLSRRLLSSLQDQFGGNVSVQKTTHGEKFNWQLNSDAAAAFLLEIEPFLILKRDQAEIVRLWWASRPKQRRGDRGRFVPTACPLDRPVWLLIKALKKTDIEAVMAAQADHVEIVHTLKQCVCVKG